MKIIAVALALITLSFPAYCQETEGHVLAIVNAGRELPAFSPEVIATEKELAITAKYFQTSPKDVSNIVWYHVKQARRKGDRIGVVEFMQAARKAIKQNGPMPPSKESLNFFGAYYETACCK